MVRAYGKQLLFFVGVCLFWLAGFANAPAVEPVVDDESPVRGLGYSLLGLLLWFGLLTGGLWVAHWTVGDDPLVFVAVLIGWGFLVAPLVVLGVLRLLFAAMSARLWAEFDKPGPRRRTRA